MSVPPPQDNNDPSSRYSFDYSTPNPYGPTDFQQQPMNPYRPTTHVDTDTESVGDVLLDELDEGLGITERAIGCSWWLFTLPFRLVWKIIGSFFD